MSAGQEKTYPIGITNKGLVALYVDMERDNGPNHSITWNCTSSLRVYDKGNNVVSTTLLDSNDLFGRDTLLAKLTRYYADAFKLASQIPNIRLLTPKEITFCDFGTDCSLGVYTVDTTNRTIAVRYKSQTMDIKKIVIGTIVNKYYKDELAAARFLELSSARVFTVDNRTLLVYHLGKGDKGTPADGSKIVPKEYKAENDFTTLKNSIYVEPILHHGYGFDVFVWL